MAQYNVTVDDRDHDAIQYPDCAEDHGWTIGGGGLDYLDTVSYCRAAQNPAVFRFTGIAVYLLMGRYTVPQSIWLSLDDQPRSRLDLTSPTGGHDDASVLWSATNLPNQGHTLALIPGERDGIPGFLNVDAFIYTTSDAEPGQIPSQGSGSTPNSSQGSGLGSGSTSILSPESGSNPKPSQESDSPFQGSSTSPASSSTPIPSSQAIADATPSKYSPLNIAAGLAGAGATIMIAILAFFLWRRMKKKKRNLKALQNDEGSTYSGTVKEDIRDYFYHSSMSSPIPTSQLLDPMRAVDELPDSSRYSTPTRSSQLLHSIRELPDYATPETNSQLMDPMRPIAPPSPSPQPTTMPQEVSDYASTVRGGRESLRQEVSDHASTVRSSRNSDVTILTYRG